MRLQQSVRDKKTKKRYCRISIIFSIQDMEKKDGIKEKNVGFRSEQDWV
jgi:hypothetical protein